MMRGFVAVDAPNNGAIARLQSEMSSAAGWNAKDVKPTEVHNLHFTVIFLGEISEIDADRIKQELSKVQFEAFSLTYAGIGAFPREEAARIIWVGVEPEGGKRLSELASKVHAALSGLGFHPDKPFSAHLTIFRVKSRHPMNLSGFAKRYSGLTFGTGLIDQIHLKKSELLPSGPIYSNIYTVEAKE